jgi:hypothetical protein
VLKIFRQKIRMVVVVVGHPGSHGRRENENFQRARTPEIFSARDSKKIVGPCHRYKKINENFQRARTPEIFSARD